MKCTVKGKKNLRSHKTSYYLEEEVPKASLTVYKYSNKKDNY